MTCRSRKWRRALFVAIALSAACAEKVDREATLKARTATLEGEPEDSEPDILFSIESDDAPETRGSSFPTLALLFSNAYNVEGTVEIRLRVVSEREEITVVVAGPKVPAQGKVAFQIPEGTLKPSPEPLAFSGLIRVDGEIRYADGSLAHSAAVFRHFHPTPDGWRSYDEETRTRVYQGGALTPEMQAAREAALRTASPSLAVDFTGIVRAQRISEEALVAAKHEDGGDHD
jgi:hypothetical protein